MVGNLPFQLLIRARELTCTVCHVLPQFFRKSSELFFCALELDKSVPGIVVIEQKRRRHLDYRRPGHGRLLFINQ